MILLVRCDDRLVHGLVAVSWTSALQPETILVANDDAAEDEFKAMTMKMAKPAGVKMFIKHLDKACNALNNPVNDNKRLFVVVDSVKDALYIHDHVKGVTKVNIGTAGVNKKPGVKYYPTLPQVYMTEEEFGYAKKLHEDGVEVFAQINPTQDRMDYDELTKTMTKNINS